MQNTIFKRAAHSFILLVPFVYLMGSTAFGQTRPQFVFCCREDNDLSKVAVANQLNVARVGTPAEAIDKAPAASGVLILADRYPEQTTPIEPALLDQAASKQLRLYIEYPGSLPDLELGKPQGIKWERAVVASDFFGPSLDKMRIMHIHGCQFTPATAKNPHLVLARIAGYDTAVFGLPTETFPILFEHPRGNMLVATTKLSQFVTGRYAPTEAWANVWQGILSWLAQQPRSAIPALKWQPTVRPTYAQQDKLPVDAEHQAMLRGVEWYKRGGQLVHASQEKHVDEIMEIEERWDVWQPNTPVGDGSCGLLEGFCSTIDHQGRQILRYILRDDCTGETAMTFALAAAVSKSETDAKIAGNLLDWLYFKSKLTKGPRSDPASPSYGLIGWRPTLPALNVYYGDGAARTMMGTMATAALLKTDKWDEYLMRCLLANFRTTGKKGFRTNRLDEKRLQAHGWRHFYNSESVNISLNYEGYLWACHLWAYRLTGYKPFLDRAKTAITITMKAYPDDWRWVNSFQLSRARMILPLAWLVRVEDTPEHRDWLKRIATDLLKYQVESGAIREVIGDLKMGGHRPPQSNAQYGKDETSLLQSNGDPVCDLLYTSNFAFLGLHEAAAATKDPLYSHIEDRLAKFFCRAQVRSDQHPELDGAWYRAFDYQKWDYWGCNGDIGWGAWCVETGWSQSWITSVLAMREMKTSFWDLTANSQAGKHFEKYRKMMLPDD